MTMRVTKTTNPKRIRATPRTAEQQAEEARVREYFEKTPRSEMIESGDLVPLSAIESLMGALAELRAERERLGISATEVARRMGVSKSWISHLESGNRSNPTFETLIRYAEAIGKGIRLSVVDAEE
jgi:DNA-binding XRE family transcriptional regulator